MDNHSWMVKTLGIIVLMEDFHHWIIFHINFTIHFWTSFQGANLEKHTVGKVGHLLF